MAQEEQKLKVSQIKSMVDAAGAGWEPAETSLSLLSDEEQEMRLGLEVREDEMRRIESLLSREEGAVSPRLSTERDWRNKDGLNWVTPVKDQGACGSCVAFGTIATIECQANIQQNKDTLDLNLSEADLFFCGAGQRCDQGWWPTYALDYAKNKGIADDKCFIYDDRNMECSLCDDKSERFAKIGNWYETINVNKRKEWLDEKGPMVACMAVYRDFFSYKSGVYRHVTGDLAGYHAVSCIGYSQRENCWICKNSWGEDWGDEGFFKIAYGQADIDTRFAMYGVEKISGPLLKEVVEEEKEGWAEAIVADYSFVDNLKIIWAYVDGKWRYQKVSDTQLGCLSNYLIGAGSIQVRYKDKQIVRIRGWRKIT